MNLIKPSFSTGYAKNASESANPNLWKGLVGAWMPSLGVTGGTLKDVSGNGNDGTLAAGMDLASDWLIDNKQIVLDFDGVDDGVSVTANFAEQFTDGFTICSLIKTRTTSSKTNAIAGEWGNGGAGNASYLLYQRFSKFYAATYNTALGGLSIQSSQNILANKWYHLVFTHTYDGGAANRGTGKLWIQGRLDATLATMPTPQQSTNYPFTIGKELTTNADAQIGLVSLHKRVLSPSEIKQLYLNPSAPFQKKTTTVVSVPVAPPTTTAKAVVLKKPKPSYATGYARNASESANPNLWKGLVGAWMPSFGVTGFTVKDASGNGNHITMDFNGVNGMTPNFAWRAGEKGRHIFHDGVNDRLLGEDYEDFSFGDGATDSPFSIESLVKFDSFKSFTAIVSKDEGGAAREWTLGVSTVSSSKYFRLFIKNQGGNNQQSVDAIDHQLQTNKWYHVVTTYDGRGGNSAYQGIKIYVDAAPSSLGNVFANSYTAMSNTSAKFQIGNYASLNLGGTNSFTFAGDIASTKIYNRALSPTEIKQLYANPAAPFLRRQQTVGISTAAVAPSANFNPFSVLTHPLEQ